LRALRMCANRLCGCLLVGNETEQPMQNCAVCDAVQFCSSACAAEA
jgi:hypothetical protein